MKKALLAMALVGCSGAVPSEAVFVQKPVITAAASSESLCVTKSDLESRVVPYQFTQQTATAVSYTWEHFDGIGLILDDTYMAVTKNGEFERGELTIDGVPHTYGTLLFDNVHKVGALPLVPPQKKYQQIPLATPKKGMDVFYVKRVDDFHRKHFIENQVKWNVDIDRISQKYVTVSGVVHDAHVVKKKVRVKKKRRWRTRTKKINTMSTSLYAIDSGDFVFTEGADGCVSFVGTVYNTNERYRLTITDERGTLEKKAGHARIVPAKKIKPLATSYQSL